MWILVRNVFIWTCLVDFIIASGFQTPCNSFDWWRMVCWSGLPILGVIIWIPYLRDNGCSAILQWRLVFKVEFIVKKNITSTCCKIRSSRSTSLLGSGTRFARWLFPLKFWGRYEAAGGTVTTIKMINNSM